MSTVQPETIERKVNWLSRMGGAYLAAFVIGLPLSVAASDIAPGSAVFAGQALAIIVLTGTAGLSFVLWLAYSDSRQLTRSGYAALISWVAVWTVLSSMNLSDGQMVDYRTYLVPLLLVMLIVKPPSREAAELAAKALITFTFLAIAVAEIDALVSGRRPTMLDFSVRFLGISIGEPARWSGPFGNPNYAGPAFAMTALYSLTLKGSTRLLVFTTSAILLVGTGSRSAILGLLAGGLIYLIFSKASQLKGYSRRVRALTLGGLGLTLGMLLVYLDPTVNGRTPIWSQHWAFWREKPFSGVGTTSISQRMVPDPDFPLDIHAHNLFLDAGSRFGIIGLLLIVLALVLSMVAVWPGAPTRSAVGLALLTAFIIIGLVEVHGSWQYWNLPWLWVILGITLTSVQQSKGETMELDPSGHSASAGIRQAEERSI